MKIGIKRKGEDKTICIKHIVMAPDIGGNPNHDYWPQRAQLAWEVAVADKDISEDTNWGDFDYVNIE